VLSIVKKSNKLLNELCIGGGSARPTFLLFPRSFFFSAGLIYTGERLLRRPPLYTVIYKYIYVGEVHILVQFL
jgi:hypothetical protein